MNEQEIMNKLGLEPWHIFLPKAKLWAAKITKEFGDKSIDGPFRQTGRTTRMIIRALILISNNKKVIFTAFKMDVANYMLKQAIMYAKKLGLDHTLLSVQSRSNNIQGLPAFILDDHYYP